MRAGGRAAVTVAGSVALAAVTSFVVGGFLGDGTFRHWLFSCAGSLEFWGVLLVASPELAPYLRRLRAALAAVPSRTQALAGRAMDWVRAKMGRPRVVSLSGTASASASGAANGSAYKSVPEGATAKEKIAFLLEQSKETQLRLDGLQQELNELPERWGSDIEATAGTLRQEHRKGLAELRDEHLTARLGGVVLLVLGLGLATWGNLA